MTPAPAACTTLPNISKEKVVEIEHIMEPIVKAEIEKISNFLVPSFAIKNAVIGIKNSIC